MSMVFDKSISQKYKRYFEQQTDFIRSHKEYSLDKELVVSKNNENTQSWESGKAGIPLSWLKDKNHVAVDYTDSHTLVIGPTGSKKSRLVAMPLVKILGSEKESMIISDPKAEIYNRTASYLSEQGYDISVINLRSPQHGNTWNPLDIPYQFYCMGEIDRAYEFVNDIAENLLKSDEKGNDPFWENSASSFFFGLTLLLFRYSKDFNMDKKFINISNVIQLRNILISQKKMGSYGRLWEYAKNDSIISSALIGTVETAKDTQAGILSTFDQKMRMFSIQPNIINMLSESNINLENIGERPTAIFLIMPDEKTGYHKLISLFLKQTYEYMIFNAQSEYEDDGLSIGKLKNRVNYILDEFSSLPTIQDFPAMITASRSRNIRYTLFIQSKHQLIQRYNDETETILTNCNNWIFLTSRETKLLEEISKLCGNTSVDNPKPILSISLLQRLDKEHGEVLILSGRSKPFVTHLPDIKKYDNDKFFSLPIPKSTMVSLGLLDFEIPLSEEEKQNNEKRKHELQEQHKCLRDQLIVQGAIKNENENLRELRIDELMKSIDKRIVELEKEE